MAQTHLQQLHAALIRRGLDVVERLRGDVDVRGAATWEITRRGSNAILRIDFAGFGGLGEDIPLEESYACQVRDHPISLYFSRINQSHNQWIVELTSFVHTLDSLVNS